ncbi:uncharacterized protein DMAD_11102 [Drosophila madeirensis]|uniref:BLOC-1-related complex subunit 7 n=1 Tax=Drosophila madeirensis TaxID=30013 RepID=A0AAU9FBY0_DROMD
MATEPPAASKLVYLAELKTRLRELRERQATDMLIRMSTSAVGETFRGALKGSSTSSSGHINIKRLIQGFENLRKTSQQLNDLHELPEELMNVDVRRLLRGYEKLIE